MNFKLGQPKQYGLITKKPIPPTNLPVKKPRVFAAELDDDDEVTDIAKVNKEMMKARMLESEKLAEKARNAVEENPDIYDYDNYVSTKTETNQRSAAAVSLVKREEVKRSKYVESIMNLSKVREKEQARIYERKLLKERKAEDELYGASTEKFVTSAYRDKLAQDAKWEYEDK